MQELAFERINRHRALAELTIYNRNWLPWWVVTAIVGDFCEQGERYLRDEGLPPFVVRLWWAYKHWRFLRSASDVDARKKGIWKQSKKMLRDHHAVNPMVLSNTTETVVKPSSVIPLAPGQRVEFIPIEVDVTHVRSAIRESVVGAGAAGTSVMNFNGLPLAPATPVTDPPFAWEDHASIADLPRPDCPKCGRSNPELGTPLNKAKDGWGDSFFTCSDHSCRHRWKWKKAYPTLEENPVRLKGTDIPAVLKWFGQCGLTVEEANEAFRRLGRVAGIDNMRRDSQKEIAGSIGKLTALEKMTPQQRLQLQNHACQRDAFALAKVTNRKETSLEKAHRRTVIRNLGVDHR